MALVTGPRGDRGTGEPAFTLTLLTRALCVCRPLSEERRPARAGVSKRGAVTPLRPCFIISFRFSATFS